MKVCDECGKILQSDAEYCIRCGSGSLTDQHQQTNNKYNNKTSIKSNKQKSISIKDEITLDDIEDIKLSRREMELLVKQQLEKETDEVKPLKAPKGIVNPNSIKHKHTRNTATQQQSNTANKNSPGKLTKATKEDKKALKLESKQAKQAEKAEAKRIKLEAKNLAKQQKQSFNSKKLASKQEKNELNNVEYDGNILSDLDDYGIVGNTEVGFERNTDGYDIDDVDFYTKDGYSDVTVGEWVMPLVISIFPVLNILWFIKILLSKKSKRSMRNWAVVMVTLNVLMYLALGLAVLVKMVLNTEVV